MPCPCPSDSDDIILAKSPKVYFLFYNSINFDLITFYILHFPPSVHGNVKYEKGKGLSSALSFQFFLFLFFLFLEILEAVQEEKESFHCRRLSQPRLRSISNLFCRITSLPAQSIFLSISFLRHHLIIILDLAVPWPSDTAITFLTVINSFHVSRPCFFMTRGKGKERLEIYNLLSPPYTGIVDTVSGG